MGYKLIKSEYYMEVEAKPLILPRYPMGKFFCVKNTLGEGLRSYEEYTGRNLDSGPKTIKHLVDRSERVLDRIVQRDLETFMDLEGCTEEEARVKAYKLFLSIRIKNTGLSPRYEEEEDG